MNEEEAIEVATAYVAAELGERLKVLGVRGERKRKRTLEGSQYPQEWLVYFERPLPEGMLSIDPAEIMVIVDKSTKQARFFPAL